MRRTIGLFLTLVCIMFGYFVPLALAADGETIHAKDWFILKVGEKNDALSSPVNCVIAAGNQLWVAGTSQELIHEFGYLSEDLRIKPIAKYSNPDWMDLSRKYVTMPAGRKCGLFKMDELVPWNGGCFRNGRVILAGSFVFWPEDRHPLIVQAIRDGKPEWTWFCVTGPQASPPSGGQPIELTASGQIILAEPEELRDLLMYDREKGLLKRFVFDRPKPPPGVTAEAPVPPALPSQELAPIHVPWVLKRQIGALHLFDNGHLLVIDAGCTRAAIIDLDGRVVMTFEEDKDTWDRWAYLGAGKDFIIAYDRTKEGGVFLSTKGDIIGRYSAAHDPQAYKSWDYAVMLGDKTMGLVSSFSLHYFQVERTKGE